MNVILLPLLTIVDGRRRGIRRPHGCTSGLSLFTSCDVRLGLLPGDHRAAAQAPASRVADVNPRPDARRGRLRVGRMIDDDLRQRRLEVIREHMDTEVTQEFDRTLATFNGHPHYEIMATGQVFDGDDEVMGYYRMTRTAFPDQRHDNVRYHVADDAVIVEFDLLGTNLGEFYGLPPTGKAFRVPIIAVFFFDGDRIVNERVYFDSASLVTQIGRGEVLALVGDRRTRSKPMKVHHLNCGTMHPSAGSECVCHVLLVETDNGLVLVDAGFGLEDCADPPGRVGPVRFFTRPVFDPDETAAHQVDRLGFRREDVRHIVITHFDTDHIGGTADFPHAQIHVTSAEAFAAFTAPTRAEKVRYGRQQWAARAATSSNTARRRSVARVLRREGTRRHRTRHRARLATRPHPRARLRRGRRRPPLGAALR